MARTNKRVEGDIEKKGGVEVGLLGGVVEISGSSANYYEFVIFNITVVTMKQIEHNFISTALLHQLKVIKGWRSKQNRLCLLERDLKT